MGLAPAFAGASPPCSKDLVPRRRGELLMLSIRQLTKVYEGGVLALQEATFDVPRGQFLAVIGLSGSGKSTFLRCINRLVEPTSGKIQLDGEDITAANQEQMRRLRRRIG